MSLTSFDDVRILIVGDALLDHYVDGRVDRISPETPVPVLVWRGERYVAGGAATGARNGAALGAHATLLSVAGDDTARDKLAECVTANHQVEVELVVDTSRPTPAKTRYVCGNHQFLRLDREHATPIGTEVEERLIAAFERRIGTASIVVLSDYATGVLSDRVLARVIASARDHRVPVVIDPKRRDFSVYRGATLIAPNRKELTDATGLSCSTDEDALEAANLAIEQTGSIILLTRSEDGMTLFRAGEQPHHLATEAHDVVDVTGAGDTVIATMAVGLGAKMPYLQAIRMANAAAGVVVTKHGTAPITREELVRQLDRDTLDEEHDGLADSLEAAVAIRRTWGEAGLTVGFTNGCFDILHPGHLALLRRARAECDRLIVAVNSDDSVRRLKGPSRPTQNEHARAVMLGGLTPVDLVVIFGEDTPLEAIRALVPDVLIKGADYREDEVVGADVVKAAGGRVVLADLVAGQSTTALLKKALASA